MHPQACGSGWQTGLCTVAGNVAADTHDWHLHHHAQIGIYRQRIAEDRCCRTADAMAAPSEVEVPRPNSSRATRLRLVARFRADAVSVSSTKNVDCKPDICWCHAFQYYQKRLGADCCCLLTRTWPEMMKSRAPVRTKMASTGVSSSDLAGTQAPTWASKAARHTWDVHCSCQMTFGTARNQWFVAGIVQGLTCLSNVLLPPMLGPVRTMKLPPLPRSTSLGTKSPPWALAAGCCRAMA